MGPAAFQRILRAAHTTEASKFLEVGDARRWVDRPDTRHRRRTARCLVERGRRERETDDRALARGMLAEMEAHQRATGRMLDAARAALP
jgi:hypothetical protein